MITVGLGSVQPEFSAIKRSNLRHAHSRFRDVAQGRKASEAVVPLGELVRMNAPRLISPPAKKLPHFPLQNP